MSIPRYLETKIMRVYYTLPRPENLTTKIMTPLYIGTIFILAAGIMPLLIALNSGSEFVQAGTGLYYLMDYAVFTVIRFIIIMTGIMMFYIVYLRPSEAKVVFPILVVLSGFSIIMWYI